MSLHINGKMRKLVLYGVGAEAERFVFRNADILEKIDKCVDLNKSGTEFYGVDVTLPSEIAPDDYIIVAVGEWSTYLLIKEYLEGKGFKEFDDFINSRFYNRKIVLINANCHGHAIESYLYLSRRFRNDYAIYYVPQIQDNKKASIDPPILMHADVFIHQDIRIGNKVGKQLSDEYIRQFLKHDCIDITMPNLVGMAGWMFPQLGGLDRIITMMNGNPYYVMYRDFIMDDAYNMGIRNMKDLLNWWNGYTYSKDDLDERFERDFQKLRTREMCWDIKIHDTILGNYRDIPYYVDANHPSAYLVKEIGRGISRILDLTDIDDSRFICDLGIPVPVHPRVSERFGFSFTKTVESYNDWLGKPVFDELEDYFRAYMWWYHTLRIA